MKTFRVFFALALGMVGPISSAPQVTSHGDFVVEATIAGIHAALGAGRLTCVETVQAYLNRIQAYDKNSPALNAIISINSKALETAAEMDAAWSGRRSAAPPL